MLVVSFVVEVDAVEYDDVSELVDGALVKEGASSRIAPWSAMND